MTGYQTEGALYQPWVTHIYRREGCLCAIFHLYYNDNNNRDIFIIVLGAGKSMFKVLIFLVPSL